MISQSLAFFPVSFSNQPCHVCTFLQHCNLNWINQPFKSRSSFNSFIQTLMWHWIAVYALKVDSKWGLIYFHLYFSSSQIWLSLICNHHKRADLYVILVASLQTQDIAKKVQFFSEALSFSKVNLPLSYEAERRQHRLNVLHRKSDNDQNAVLETWRFTVVEFLEPYKVISAEPEMNQTWCSIKTARISRFIFMGEGLRLKHAACSNFPDQNMEDLSS